MLLLKASITLVTFGLIYFRLQVVIQRLQIKSNVKLEAEFATMKACLLVLVIHFYVFFIIRYNGMLLFDWGNICAYAKQYLCDDAPCIYVLRRILLHFLQKHPAKSAI